MRASPVLKVHISTYGSVSREVGWSNKELKLEHETATVEDVLRAVELEDGRTLFDLVEERNGGIKDGCTVMVNGRPLWGPDNLTMQIEDKDVVTALDVLYLVGGG